MRREDDRAPDAAELADLEREQAEAAAAARRRRLRRVNGWLTPLEVLERPTREDRTR